MPIRRTGSYTPYSRPLSVGQIKQDRQDRQERRMLKPRRVASTWQENIAARVRPRSENRWRVNRAQPWLATLLQFLMLAEQLKSVVSVPEAPGRLPLPVFTPTNSSGAGTGGRAGKASPADLPTEATLQQTVLIGGAANATTQQLASGLRAMEQTPLDGASFKLSGNLARIARHIRQAPAPSRRIRHAKHRHIVSTVPSAAIADSTDASVGTKIRSRLDHLPPSLLPDYLKAQGYSLAGESSGCEHAVAVMTALHRYLKPASIFPGDPGSLDRLDAPALESLMRHMAQANGFYGAHDGERSAPQFQRELLLKLLAPWAQDCASSDDAQTSDPDLPATMHGRTTAWINALEIRRLQDAGLTNDAAQWLAGLLRADVEPTLARADTPGDLRYGSLEWTDLQVGVDLADAVGLDHWSMSYVELVGLTQSADMTARQHPDAAAELLAPQVRAALSFAEMAIEPDDPDSGRRIEAAVTLLNEARTERWEAAQHKVEALEALQAPMPTRGGIGAKIMRDHDLDPERHLMVRRRRLGVIGEYFEDPGKTMLNRYMGGDRSCSLYGDGEDREDADDKCILPDLDPLFDDAFKHYAASHRRAFGVLLDYAVQALPQQDRTFWQKGKAQVLAPEVRAGNFLTQKVQNANLGSLLTRSFFKHSLYHAKPSTAIVAITHNRKTRHYLVAMTNGEGRLIRFLAQDLPHNASAGSGHAKVLDAVLLPWLDDLVVQAGAVRAAEHRGWKLAADGKSGAAVPGLAGYFAEATEKLRSRAYQATQGQQFEQAVMDSLKSMVPFYDCVNEIKEGNTGAAIFSCALDVVNLIPMVGPALKSGAGIARLAVRFNVTALKQLANAAAAGSFRQALGRVAGAQAKLVGGSGAALAWETLQALDPGVQLFHLTGKGLRSVGKGLRSTGKGLQALLTTLRQTPPLKTLADRVGGLLKRKPFHFSAAGIWQIDADAVVRRDGRRFAQIGEREVEVIRLGGDLPHTPAVRVADPADARFMLAEPLQGRPYGPQWAPTADGLVALADYRIDLAAPIPAPNDQGVIHIGPGAYIRMDGAHYPVREDADRQGWRIIREGHPDDAPVPVSYDAGRGLWEVPRTSLGDLPEEVRSRIAAYLSDADTASLSQTDPRWNQSLEPDLRARRLTEEARSVENLTQMRQLLGDIDKGTGIRDLEIPLREGPLTQLTQRIGELPPIERWTAFHDLYEAISQLSPRYRGSPLAALAGRIGELAADLRQIEYERIFNEALRLPPQRRAQPLAALAGQLGHLADNHPVRWDAFHQLFRETLLLDGQHRGAPLAALAAALPHLPEGARLDRFDLLFAELGTLAAGQRAGPLASLSAQIGVLRADDRPLAFNRLLGQIETIPAQRRAEPLNALINQLPLLPEDRWLKPFNSVARAAAWLDVGGHGPHLMRVAESLIRLPSERRLEAIRSLLRAARTLDPEPRAGQYAELAQRIFSLPEHHRLDGFDAVFDAATLLPAQHRIEPLAPLADNLGWMPENRRLDEFNRILGQMERIPAQHRELLLDALTRQVGGIPHGRLLDVFENLTAAVVAPGPGLHGDSLMRMARIIDDLPETRQTMAFDRLIETTEPLAADLRSEQLTRLAGLGPHLPPDRLASLRSLLRAVGTLDEARRGAHYVQFAGLIDQLPSHRRQAFFDDVFQEVLALSAEQRTTPLQALVERFASLPEHGLIMFTSLSRASGLAAPVHRAALLQLLAERIRLIEPAEDRGRAWRRVLREASELPPETRAVVHVTLAQRIAAIQWDQDRLSAYHELLAAIRALPSEYRNGPLVAVADNMPQLPGLEPPVVE